ncbi:MAG TPA: hypothetical protein PKD85_19190, partial [Saprospiraceae bacterium]|nr:hypothetical protein [Saprospiraceae bacterium]
MMTKTSNIYFAKVTLVSLLINLVFSSCTEKSNVQSSRPFFFSQDIHSNEQLFIADSLYILKHYESAVEIYYTLLSFKIEENLKNYIKWKIYSATKNEKKLIKLYTNYLEKKIEFPNILIPELYLFGIENNLKQFEIQRIRLAETNISTPYYKAIAQLCLGRYYEEISEDLDSSWHHLNLAHRSFIQTKVISDFHIKCVEKLTIHSTYKRNNLLAIRFANYLFNYEKHYPVIDSLTKAKL